MIEPHESMSTILLDAEARIRAFESNQRRSRLIRVIMTVVVLCAGAAGIVAFEKHIERALARLVVGGIDPRTMEPVPPGTQDQVRTLLAHRAGFTIPDGCTPVSMCRPPGKDSSLWIKFECTEEGIESLESATKSWEATDRQYMICRECFGFDGLLASRSIELFRTLQGDALLGYSSLWFLQFGTAPNEPRTAYLYYMPMLSEDESEILKFFPGASISD